MNSEDPATSQWLTNLCISHKHLFWQTQIYAKMNFKKKKTEIFRV